MPDLSSRSSSRTPLAVLAALLVTAIAVALPAPAAADDPPRLDDQITDRVNALGDRKAEAQAALDRLRDATGLQLFVVFVESFDGTPAQQWAEQTATRSDLGRNDGLLAVATEDRAYAYNVDSAQPLTDAQLDEVARVAIEPALARNDWAGAVVGAADGYRAVLTGQPVTAPKIVPGDAHPSASSGVGIGLVFAGLCLLVVLAAVGVGIWLYVRRQRRAAAPAVTGPSTEELAARANGLLLELDDAVRTSERELSLASAEYGEETTAPFTAALASARTDIGEAFRLRMLLESPAADGGPADEAGRRELLTDIIERCEHADATLDAQAEAFDELREIETRIESTIPALDARRDALAPRVAAAAAALADLAARYTPAALNAVAANPQQAAERLTFASSALQTAAAELVGTDRPAAAVAVRAAEQALDQIDTLLKAIERTGTDLDAARAGLDALLGEVDADLAAARAARATAGTPPAVATALAAAVEAAEQVAGTARTALTSSTVDPLALSRQLQQVDAALDEALASARDASERTTRARAMLDQAIQAARAEIAAAGSFVTTRRGAVLEQARTLLAEAQRHLARAESLATDDPVTALAEARQADSLAEQAGAAARSDVDAWGGGGGGFAGPRSGGVDAGLGGLAGAVLGGILIGGTRRRGGFGGGFGGGGFGGGFGGHSTGGFGGSGSRHGGGGRF